MLEEELYNDCAAFLVAEDEQGRCGWVMQGCRWSWTRAILPTWWCGRDTGVRHIAAAAAGSVYLRFAQSAIIWLF